MACVSCCSALCRHLISMCCFTMRMPWQTQLQHCCDAAGTSCTYQAGLESLVWLHAALPACCAETADAPASLLSQVGGLPSRQRHALPGRHLEAVCAALTSAPLHFCPLDNTTPYLGKGQVCDHHSNKVHINNKHSQAEANGDLVVHRCTDRHGHWALHVQ